MHHMHGTHDLPLVALSFIIAFMASLTALDIARRIHFSKGWQRKLWLLSGSFAMGIGIWAMHFIAMLAHQLPVPISYDVFLVVLSVVVAVAASLCGLYFTCQSKMNNTKLFIGGLFMGLGISGMHYIGMAAMRGVHITYRPFFFSISILIAIGASIIALMLAFRFRESEKGISSRAKLISGMVMGIAIAGMHYTGMVSAIFTPVHQGTGVGASSDIDIYAIVISVAISTVVILGIMLVISFLLDRRLNEEIAFKGAILESVLDCVIIIDRNGNILECNPSVIRTFGYSREDILGQNMEKKLFSRSSLNNTDSSPSLTSNDGKLICDTRMEVTGIRRSGTEFPVEMTITRIKKEGLPAFTVYARDITEFKETEETIRQMAYQDTLTGLPNRRLFNEYLTESLKEAEDNKTLAAVAFLDLDRFKLINDSMGHTFGDLLLKSVAERLQACLGTQNVVSRNGGDEFTIILKDTTEQEAENTAKRIIHSLTRPFYLEDHEVFITTSIGLSMYPKDGKDEETLIKNADTAMYDAKEQGRNGFSFFKPENDMKISQRLQLENELRMALERNEFVVYYQPQLNIHTEQIIGVEALVRWVHPERGIIQPNDFIPQAEESGLIIPIGNWVLRTAIAQCKKWQDNLFPLKLSVNLSALQFKQPDIVKMISDILKNEELDPSLLNLEITESMAMHVEHSTEVLRDLKKLGINISMDDFGTGYSSLGYLKKMPIDYIKIDRSFMSNINYDLEDAAIVKAIISMAQSLNINVIAEGVEDEEQLLFLQNLQCHEIQGYLLSPPIPAENLEKLVTQPKAAMQFTKTNSTVATEREIEKSTR
ncbi:bifunctional diguanylate cyclase/phosphodiesterase [Bacillus aerolatus]|nr:bifunctional diguanylate cyclase/phosphodiesterase [Bacillus aerolatus]